MTNWNQRFLDLARTVAGWSKDPSSQVGAVLVRPDRTIVSLGFNGFPRGVKDLPERLNDREKKYPRVVHSEANCILTARGDTFGNTLYSTLHPCSNCAALIIQAGIARVVYPDLEIPERWRDNFNLAAEMFAEAGVEAIASPG